VFHESSSLMYWFLLRSLQDSTYRPLQTSSLSVLTILIYTRNTRDRNHMIILSCHTYFCMCLACPLSLSLSLVSHITSVKAQFHLLPKVVLFLKQACRFLFTLHRTKCEYRHRWRPRPSLGHNRAIKMADMTVRNNAGEANIIMLRFYNFFII
jgi:hypothetical protein